MKNSYAWDLNRNIIDETVRVAKTDRLIFDTDEVLERIKNKKHIAGGRF